MRIKGLAVGADIKNGCDEYGYVVLSRTENKDDDERRKCELLGLDSHLT